jgi:xylulokinase
MNKRVVTLATQEGSAYGAALLALASKYGSVPEVCRAAIREVESCQPRAAEAAAYARGHRVYRSLYPALKPAYQEMAALG